MNKKRFSSVSDAGQIGTPYGHLIQDVDDVTLLRMANGLAPSSRQKRSTPKSGSAPSAPLLIDIVTPQPKAFFAYLQMPKKSPSKKVRSAKASGRIARNRKVGG